jgi:hypothetical protein
VAKAARYGDSCNFFWETFRMDADALICAPLLHNALARKYKRSRLYWDEDEAADKTTDF